MNGFKSVVTVLLQSRAVSRAQDDYLAHSWVVMMDSGKTFADSKKFEDAISRLTLEEVNAAVRKMLVEKNITLYSTCEHHFLPIVGKAHVAYISHGSVIGLSKLNRIVDYYARRPQVQERLTMQIVRELQKALGTEDVACVIDAKHLCVNSRGIRDVASATVTAEYGGAFKDEAVRREFLRFIELETHYQ